MVEWFARVGLFNKPEAKINGSLFLYMLQKGIKIERRLDGSGSFAEEKLLRRGDLRLMARNTDERRLMLCWTEYGFWSKYDRSAEDEEKKWLSTAG